MKSKFCNGRIISLSTFQYVTWLRFHDICGNLLRWKPPAMATMGMTTKCHRQWQQIASDIGNQVPRTLSTKSQQQWHPSPNDAGNQVPNDIVNQVPKDIVNQIPVTLSTKSRQRWCLIISRPFNSNILAHSLSQSVSL